MTSRTPAQRFEQHKSRPKAAKYSRKFGVRFTPRLYRLHNPMTYNEGVEVAREKTRRLPEVGLRRLAERGRAAVDSWSPLSLPSSQTTAAAENGVWYSRPLNLEMTSLGTNR